MYVLYFVLIGVAVAAGQKQLCNPEEFFYEACNICNCDRLGMYITCTKMACNPGLYDAEGNFLYDVSKSFSNHCEPGKKFVQEYEHLQYSCVCTMTGDSAMCTLKTGPNDSPDDTFTEELKDQLQVYHLEDQVCQPGELFFEKCSTCLCSNNGKSADCTKMFCPEDPK